MDSQAYEKTCPICGILFQTDNCRRKYCDACKDHPGRKSRQMDTNIRMSKIRCGDYDRPVHTSCKQCNKPIVITKDAQPFCSSACRMQYTMENRKCTYCGKKLYPEVKITREGGAAFHPKCREPYYERRARWNGKYKICPVCEKEFRVSKQDQRYCGKECKHIAETDLERYGKECPCLVCGKLMKIPYDSMAKPLCSEKCRNSFPRNFTPHKDEERKTILPKTRIPERMDKSQREKDKIAEKIRQREEENRKNGLCGYCKTSYKDCPYVSSGFRTRPNDAKYENSKIVECPIFKDSRPPIPNFANSQNQEREI